MTRPALKTALRWLAIIPAAVLACFGVLFVGLCTNAYLEDVLCPKSDWVSGFCTNDFVQEVRRWLALLFAWLSAFAVVLTATLLAPRAKTSTAWLALLVGGLFAGQIFAFQREGAANEILYAVALGTLTALAITLRAKRGKNSAP